MGADQIYMQFNGIVSDTFIKRKIAQQAAYDNCENGHRDGYSGDWQCVHDFKRVPGFFNSLEEARQYLSENCKKWEPALVVQYLTKDPTKPTVRTIVSAVVPC